MRDLRRCGSHCETKVRTRVPPTGRRHGRPADLKNGAHGFEIEGVFTQDGDLLVLPLGFAPAGDPLDVLHVACGLQRGGSQPPRVEDLLHLERIDQDPACDGREVIGWPGVERDRRAPAAIAEPGLVPLLRPSRAASDRAGSAEGHGGRRTGLHRHRPAGVMVCRRADPAQACSSLGRVDGRRRSRSPWKTT
jgi:hypothetical protein